MVLDRPVELRMATVDDRDPARPYSAAVPERYKRLGPWVCTGWPSRTLRNPRGLRLITDHYPEWLPMPKQVSLKRFEFMVRVGGYGLPKKTISQVVYCDPRDFKLAEVIAGMRLRKTEIETMRAWR